MCVMFLPLSKSQTLSEPTSEVASMKAVPQESVHDRFHQPLYAHMCDSQLKEKKTLELNDPLCLLSFFGHCH